MDNQYHLFSMGTLTKTLLSATLALTFLGADASGQQPAKTTEVPPAFRELQQVENRWDDAVTKRDQYAMELVLAPQFIGISASGDVTTRNQQISRLVKGLGPDSLEQKVISVRFVGDVAIVNGTYVMTWKGEKGPVLEKGVFSHVFERVRDNWLCLNSQHTVVAEEDKGAAPKEKPKARRSDAELPMHVPLIYKGPDSTKPAPPPGTNQPPQ